MTEEEFYDKIPEWLKTDIANWNHITLLAYFCHKYEKVNGIRFKLVRSKKGPTSTKESRDFAKLFKVLAPENYESLPKDEKNNVRIVITKKIGHYINWMFDFKFKKTGLPINGTQTFLSPSILNEFERMYVDRQSKSKNKDIFKTLIEWVTLNHPQLLEDHQLDRVEDLKMIQSYISTYNLPHGSAESELIKKSKEMGLL